MYSKYTGVILKNFPLNEADELLTIYTKETGKLRVLARGARRIQSRLAGALQSLNEIEFETAGSARRSGALPTVISARILTMNDYLRQNLKKFAFALIGIETLYRMTADGQESPEGYRALTGFLRDLGESKDENKEVRNFQLQLLKIMGFAPPGGGEISEAELDRLLGDTLEREIKSKRFLKSISN